MQFSLQGQTPEIVVVNVTAESNRLHIYLLMAGGQEVSQHANGALGTTVAESKPRLQAENEITADLGRLVFEVRGTVSNILVQ